MLQADFQSILKPLDEQCREKIKQMKAKPKGKLPHREKINLNLPSGWCLQRTFAHGDVLDLIKMYHGKN